jgi:hypothetical protein
MLRSVESEACYIAASVYAETNRDRTIRVTRMNAAERKQAGYRFGE